MRLVGSGGDVLEIGVVVQHPAPWCSAKVAVSKSITPVAPWWPRAAIRTCTSRALSPMTSLIGKTTQSSLRRSAIVRTSRRSRSE